MTDEKLSISIEFRGDLENAEVLPDGSRILFGAVITEPAKWAGQVRDIIIWPDGSVHLGTDQERLP